MTTNLLHVLKFTYIQKFSQSLLTPSPMLSRKDYLSWPTPPISKEISPNFQI